MGCQVGGFPPPGNAMRSISMKSTIRPFRYAAPLFLRLFLIAFFTGAGAALTEAAEYRIGINGTVDNHGDTVHGQNGSAIPVNLTLTFDTNNGGQTAFAAQGTTPAPLPNPLVSNFCGYSKANITATDITFGSRRWSKTNIVPIPVGTANVADIRFNAPIEENPSRIMMRLLAGSDVFDLGMYRYFESTTDFDPGCSKNGPPPRRDEGAYPLMDLRLRNNAGVAPPQSR